MTTVPAAVISLVGIYLMERIRETPRWLMGYRGRKRVPQFKGRPTVGGNEDSQRGLVS